MNPEHGPDHLALARAALAEERHALAAEHAVTAAQETDDPAVRQAALELAAELNLALGRPHEALAWTDQLRADAGDTLAVDLLEAAARLQLDDPEGALSLLEGVSRDSGPPTLHDLRGRALLASGRAAEAAAEVRALLGIEAAHAPGWQALAALCDAGELDPAPFVAALPDDAVLDVLGALVDAPPSGADLVAEHLWDRQAGDPRVVAFLAVVGGEFGLERALEWSARLRRHGAEEHCPLLGVAANEGRPGRERLRAAAAAAVTFADERAEPLAELAVHDVADDDLGAAVTEVALLAPDLVDGVIVAAASTSARTRRLAELARAHGDERGAAALTRHADTLTAGPSS